MLNKCKILLSMSLIFCINLRAGEAVRIVPVSTSSRLTMEQYLELKELVSPEIKEGMEVAEVHEVALVDDIFPEIEHETLVWIVSSKENYLEALQVLLEGNQGLVPKVLEAGIHLGIQKLLEAGKEVWKTCKVNLDMDDSGVLLSGLARIAAQHKNYRIVSRESLLYASAAYGLDEVVQNLLEAGVERSVPEGIFYLGTNLHGINDSDEKVYPLEMAFLAAVGTGRLSLVKTLLATLDEKLAMFNSVAEPTLVGLIGALCAGQVEVAKFLCDNFKIEIDEEALLLAVASKDEELARLIFSLRKEGASCNKALIVACYLGDEELLEMCLQAGADITYSITEPVSLISERMRGSWDREQILNYGSPFTAAAAGAHVKLLERLHSMAVIPQEQLAEALCRGARHTEVISFLLEVGTFTTQELSTALANAGLGKEGRRLLLDAGARPASDGSTSYIGVSGGGSLCLISFPSPL